MNVQSIGEASATQILSQNSKIPPKTGKRWLFDEEKRLVREEGFLKWQAKHHEVRRPWHHRATLMEYTVVFVQSTHLSGGIPDSRIVERCEDMINMSCKLLYSSLF